MNYKSRLKGLDKVFGSDLSVLLEYDKYIWGQDNEHYLLNTKTGEKCFDKQALNLWLSHNEVEFELPDEMKPDYKQNNLEVKHAD